MPTRPKANSIHTAAWHAWTWTPPLNIVQKAVFSPIHFPALHLSAFGYRPILIWGDQDMAGGCSQDKPNSFQMLQSIDVMSDFFDAAARNRMPDNERTRLKAELWNKALEMAYYFLSWWRFALHFRLKKCGGCINDFLMMTSATVNEAYPRLQF